MAFPHYENHLNIQLDDVWYIYWNSECTCKLKDDS